MTYFQKVWKSDAKAVIEDLIKAGEYDKAQGGVKDIVAEIRSMEDGYRKAKRLCMLLKFETDRTKSSGIAVTDRTEEISDVVESGDFNDAVDRAKAAIKELKKAEEEHSRAENSLLILRSDISRASGKGAAVPYNTSGVEDLIAKGSYLQAVSDSEEIIAKVRNLEEGYDSASRLYGVIMKWLSHFEERGIRLPLEDGELKSLIDEGRYDEAIPLAHAILDKLPDYGEDFLGRLKSELERCGNSGIALPFDAGEVEEALRNGDYDGARSIADRLFSDIQAIENDHRRATDLIDRLKAEIGRLHEKGIVIAADDGSVGSMMESGEYAKTIPMASDLLVASLSIEKDYDAAIEAMNALKGEMSRLNGKGVVFPDDISGIEGMIEKGMYHDARIKANAHEVQIRLVESDHDFAASVFDQLDVEIKRLEGLGVVFSVETGPVQDLIASGKYDQARKEAESGLINLWAADSEFESAIEFLQTLNHDYDRVVTKGVVVSNEADQVEELIKKGEYHKSRSLSESLLAGIRKTEEDYDSANEARKGLMDEIGRLKEKGIVFEDPMPSLDRLIGSGEYENARRSVEEVEAALWKTESEYDSAAAAFSAYKKEVARAGAKEIPISDGSASVESLLSAGSYRDARLEAEALLSRVKSLAWEYELAVRSYESLVREIDRLKEDGVIVTEDPSSVKDFIESGSYPQAKSIAESLHSRIKATEWEYQLAVRARDDLKRIVDEMRDAGEEPGVNPDELDQWMERGDYRKVKSMADDMAGILFK